MPERETTARGTTVLQLSPDGTELATGSITADDLVGPLEGMTIDDLVTAIEEGHAYVNVHTNDGVGESNSGPGDFPGGEVRGQIG